jgi:UDP-3-O-[3-hydroxymyristoyl] glucosamine N-acyltransferase
MNWTIEKIAAFLGGDIIGSKDLIISGLAKIEDAKPGEITFLANPKYDKFASDTKASAIIVGKEFNADDKTVIKVKDPYLAFMTLAKEWADKDPHVEPGIHPTAVIAPGVTLGADVHIGPYVVIGKKSHIGAHSLLHAGVVIGDHVSIGENCTLYPRVSIREYCRIGDRVILQNGAVIGSDGFGYAFHDGQYHKIPQTGIVAIEDDVEIGANTTIDRAALGETRIGQGCKIDNLVQIAHNVQIDNHTAIAAQVGISGSTQIGQYVRIGGQAGFVGHVKIGDKAIVGAQAGVTKGIPENVFFSGYPARENMKAKREEASLARLPELLKTFRQMAKRIDALESRLGDENSHRSDSDEEQP